MSENVQVAERMGLAHLNLRGDPEDAAFLAAIKGVFGVDLPRVANTTARAGEHTVCWLGPDEWLVLSTADSAALVNALQAAIGELHSSVTEIGGGNVVLVLRGANVRELLARDCPLDLHPRELGPGRCAQTRLGKTAVLLRPLDDGAMELVARRSFVSYLRLWFREAGATYSEKPVR
ncbi:MAG: sarcosine oxidase subunit gamma family protein [Usitatibacter sp.]